MTTISREFSATATGGVAESRVRAAARRLYEADLLTWCREELAVHAARQSRVDRWVAAAMDRLHEAVVEHLAAMAELHEGSP